MQNIMILRKIHIKSAAKTAGICTTNTTIETNKIEAIITTSENLKSKVPKQLRNHRENIYCIEKTG